MMKSRQDNDMTNCTSKVYIEIETELSWSIKQNAVYTKTRLDNDVTNRTLVVYAKIEIEISWPIGQDVVYHEKQSRWWCD